MAMRAGKMRHRVTVQQRASSQSASGEQANTWSTFATRYASIQPLSGREFFAAQQRGASVTTQIRMRFLDGLVPRMRIVWGLKVFDVVAVMNPDGLSTEHLVMAEELVEATP